MEMIMLIDAKQSRKGKPDPSLVKLIVKARKLKEHFIRGGDRMDAIAASAGVSRAYFTRLVKLSFLAPRHHQGDPRVGLPFPLIDAIMPACFRSR